MESAFEVSEEQGDVDGRTLLLVHQRIRVIIGVVSIHPLFEAHSDKLGTCVAIVVLEVRELEGFEELDLKLWIRQRNSFVVLGVTYPFCETTCQNTLNGYYRQAIKNPTSDIDFHCPIEH